MEDPTDVSRVRQLELSLDAGEAAAIVLALEKKAAFVLIDEFDGRKAAKSLGLVVVGVLGLLVHAKQGGLIPAVLPLVDVLVRDIEFHISPAVVAEVRRLATE